MDVITCCPNLFRRFVALCIGKRTFARDGDVDEIVGHAYLFLKEQLELPTMPPPSGILHGTMIGEAFSSVKPTSLLLKITF